MDDALQVACSSAAAFLKLLVRDFQRLTMNMDVSDYL